MSDLLVYGAYGYTGERIVRRAVERGWSPVVAGRNPRKLDALVRDLGVEPRPFSLSDAGTVAENLEDVDAVLNCAGPFVDTAAPVVAACLETGTHYMDVTGEIDVFEAIAGQDDRAREAGVTLLPGVGFDVVPTDCLAADLHERLPEATHLSLAFEGLSGASSGTARTAVKHLSGTTRVREDGRIREEPIGRRTREIDFGDDPRASMAIPWGDVATAYHTTGIGNVTVYAGVGRNGLRAVRALRPLSPALDLPGVRSSLERLAAWTASGPRNEHEGIRVWGEVTDGETTETARLRTPEPYELTVRTALAIGERVLDGETDPGFRTPAGAFGSEFVYGIDGVERLG